MKLHSLVLGLLLVVVYPVSGAPTEGKASAKVVVSCSRASAFVHVNIASYRPIGRVVIEVKNATGLTLYKEEGKALTPELVRRLDKGGFPRGSLILSVTAKDFAITRTFTIE